MSLIGFCHTMPNMGSKTPEPEPPIGGVKIKNILSLSLDNNDIDKIASIMKMKLYHKWELNETGGLDLYIEDWFSSSEDFNRT
jgi:hypothetical protein